MASRSINVLSLCSGAGGLDLAIRRALPDARTVCYVEREIPAGVVLASAMEDQRLLPLRMAEDLEGEDTRLIALCVRTYLTADERTKADIRAFHESGGPEMVEDASLRICLPVCRSKPEGYNGN